MRFLLCLPYNLLRLVILIVLITKAYSAFAGTVEIGWMPFDILNQADRDQAEAEVTPLFGDADHWPDWLDARVLPMDGWLIVRHPVRETCGGYRFTIFGSPPDRGGPRPKLGEFCGGDLHITNAKGQSLPDLLLTEASPLDPNDTTPARVVHLHRVGSEWMIMKTR